MSATAAALSSVSANPGDTADARCTNSCNDATPDSASTGGRWSGSGNARDGVRQLTSPSMRNGSRLVASTEISGQPCSSSVTVRAHASIRCSQLSRTTSSCRPRSCATSESIGARRGGSSSRSASAISSTIRSPSAKRGKLDQDCAVAIALVMSASQLYGQRRLAGTTRARQRH